MHKTRKICDVQHTPYSTPTTAKHPGCVNFLSWTSGFPKHWVTVQYPVVRISTGPQERNITPYIITLYCEFPLQELISISVHMADRTHRIININAPAQFAYLHLQVWTKESNRRLWKLWIKPLLEYWTGSLFNYEPCQSSPHIIHNPFIVHFLPY